MKKTKTLKINKKNLIINNYEYDILNLIDLDDSINFIDLTLNINHSCIIYFSTLTAIDNKNININLIINSSDIDIALKINSLTSNNKKTDIKVLAKNNINIENVNIDMQITGILSNPKDQITCIPVYEFNTNKINATHGLIIGTFNFDELFALLTKGINKEEAKTMLIWSKFNDALQNVSTKQREIYYSIILDRWGKYE